MSVRRRHLSLAAVIIVRRSSRLLLHQYSIIIPLFMKDPLPGRQITAAIVTIISPHGCLFLQRDRWLRPSTFSSEHVGHPAFTVPAHRAHRHTSLLRVILPVPKTQFLRSTSHCLHLFKCGVLQWPAASRFGRRAPSWCSGLGTSPGACVPLQRQILSDLVVSRGMRRKSVSVEECGILR